MNTARRAKIQDLAEAVRHACGLATPVDVRAAVSCLGGRLETAGDGEYEARIEKEDDGFLITLTEDVSDGRFRFSVAHELGHLFLHMGFLDDESWGNADEYTDSVYYRFGHTVEEYEAHEFAGAFLMPSSEFKRIAAQHQTGGTFDVNAIARHFGVSSQAALTRGRWLGLFRWG
jgi:Zn-dependent peptidase ImmA (M78 family)